MTRTWGFAESAVEARRRQDDMATLVGEEIIDVVYYTIDYRRHELRRDLAGLRWITAAAEWDEPTWETPICDSVDYGVELQTRTGRRFSVTWDPPGWREGMGISEALFVGSVLEPTADAAAWRVTARPSWASVLQSPVSSVQLNFIPWAQETNQYWCTRVTIDCGDATAVLMLGEGTSDGQIRPSSDNIAVLFDDSDLPIWEQREPKD